VETQLRNKVVLITGASGGIGSAVARAFAVEGAHLVLHGHRNLAGLRRLQKELGQVESLLVSADLIQEAEVKKYSPSRKNILAAWTRSLRMPVPGKPAMSGCRT
jgi:NADP-dependent 3-hydroxy acid dehydrogenase YdfG